MKKSSMEKTRYPKENRHKNVVWMRQRNPLTAAVYTTMYYLYILWLFGLTTLDNAQKSVKFEQELPVI